MPLTHIPIERILEDPSQPRRRIDDEAIAEMAETMKTVGVIEPVIVRPDAENYRLIVGHRRHRAASVAGLSTIPAIVRHDISDLETMRLQAVEDAQTEELDPKDRYAFWARLWAAEREANPAMTLGQFSKEVIGKSETYVKAGIQVAEEAPEELKALLGRPEDGMLNPSYARYIVNDRSLSSGEKVAVARKIAAGTLPASGGRIGTETLRLIRQAPGSVRDRLINDPEYGLERAKWDIEAAERDQAVERTREQRLLGPGEIAFKLIRATLDFHTKLDPRIAPHLPEAAWDELQHRFGRLEQRMSEFRASRLAPATSELLESIDSDALKALIEQRDDPGAP